jgi:hypothetical protein
MDSLVTRCTFCGTRHLVNIDDLDIWFAMCGCGAFGFVQDEAEVSESGLKGLGFIVHEVINSSGVYTHMADPLPIFVNERNCWVYVCWYKEGDGPQFKEVGVKF